MTDINTICAKAAALGRDIKSLVQLSQYHEYDDLSGVKIDRDDPEQRFRLDAMQNIMEALSDVQSDIEYMDSPIEEVSVIHENHAGRYETEDGTELIQDTELEALIYDDNYGCYCWKKTRFVKIVNSYCLYDHVNIPLDGLTVRIRKQA